MPRLARRLFPRRWARVRPKSPPGSVQNCSIHMPAAASSASIRSRRNLAEISVRISSPGSERHGQAEVCDRDLLIAQRPQPHLDPLVDRVPQRDVLELVDSEVGAELPVDHEQDVAVELRRHPGRIVVRALQPVGVLDEVRPEEEGIPGTERSPDLREKGRSGLWFEITDCGADKRNHSAPAARNGTKIPLEITKKWRNSQARVLRGQRVGGLGQHRGVDVERHELAQRPAVAQRAQQQPGLGRRAAAELDQRLAPRQPGDLGRPLLRIAVSARVR